MHKGVPKIHIFPHWHSKCNCVYTIQDHRKNNCPEGWICIPGNRSHLTSKRIIRTGFRGHPIYLPVPLMHRCFFNFPLADNSHSHFHIKWWKLEDMKKKKIDEGSRQASRWAWYFAILQHPLLTISLKVLFLGIPVIY